MRCATSVKSAIEAGWRRRTLWTIICAPCVIWASCSRRRRWMARERERERCYRRDRIMNCCWGCKWGAVPDKPLGMCAACVLYCCVRYMATCELDAINTFSNGSQLSRRSCWLALCAHAAATPPGAKLPLTLDSTSRLPSTPHRPLLWLIERAPFYRCTCTPRIFCFTKVKCLVRNN